MNFIDKVEAVDEKTVKVTLQYAYAPFLALCTTYSQVVKEEFYKDGEVDMAKNPIGSGPYKFKKWAQGDKIELDVYKRQPRKSSSSAATLRIFPCAAVCRTPRCCLPMSVRLMIRSMQMFSRRRTPVSYTHLDVYKRQLICCRIKLLLQLLKEIL